MFEIEKNLEFQHSDGNITIKVIPGDAHLMTTLVYKNGKLIKNGDGTIEVIVEAKTGDLFKIISTVFKQVGSDHASITIIISNENHTESLPIKIKVPDHDTVVFKVNIQLI